MKRVINGKTYNTETAKEICFTGNNSGGSDFSHDNSYLYLTKNGQFFIAGDGGPNSRWAEYQSYNERTSGSGLILVTPDEARGKMESARCTAEQFLEAGFTLEEG